MVDEIIRYDPVLVGYLLILQEIAPLVVVAAYGVLADQGGTSPFSKKNTFISSPMTSMVT